MSRHEITADMVRTLLDYNPETGSFTWKERTPDLFIEGSHSAEHQCRQWNSRFAGKNAGARDARGYLNLHIFCKSYRGHRLAWVIMTGEWPVDEIDHINGVKSDNRFANLREATSSENKANIGVRRNNITRLKGVAIERRRHRRWVANIADSGRCRYIGSFDCPAAAHFAYLIEADKAYGEFARAA